ncbi:MAG: alkaline phosphatase family protein [Ferruginibacter sp.]
MSLLRTFFLLMPFIFFETVSGQTSLYTTANAHSHNDYLQQAPFLQAYHEGFGSIEPDVHLRNGLLLVGHDSNELTKSRTLENMYLLPLADYASKNNGYVYNDTTKKLQLLIDIKTDSIHTLDAIIDLLNKYPVLTKNPSLRFVITGNRPAPSLYNSYPSFIWFDGRPGVKYDIKELSRIALLSDDVSKYTKWKKRGVMTDSEEKTIQSVVMEAHRLQKPIRFWGCPDSASAWKKLQQLNIDFINTDHIKALSEYFSRQKDSMRLMPFNRIIHSAGNVIRFGDPKLENHALDAAALPGNKVVIEDRYGLTVIDVSSGKIITRWSLSEIPAYNGFMSTYSGICTFSNKGKTWVMWSVAEKDRSAVIIAEWANGFRNFTDIPFEKNAPAKNALPNDVEIAYEKGKYYLYVVLNGNNELLKIDWDKKVVVWKAATGVAPYGIARAKGNVYVSNWAGDNATDSSRERAGVPWGLAYTDPVTGATGSGTVSVFDAATGKRLKDIETGLHPTAIKISADGRDIYVANGSSDNISVINTTTNKVTETIQVGLLRNDKNKLQGSTPTALELNKENTILYVANGFDNAIAVVQLGSKASATGKRSSYVQGYIPTEAYPGGVLLLQKKLVVTNLESDGANVVDDKKQARFIHNQLASVSIIPLPGKSQLKDYTQQVAQLSLISRLEPFKLLPRENVAPAPVPERLGEPSVFKHVVYIIKENKTYDQVFGDMPEGRGDSSLCIFGQRITPNMHALAKQFGWMDDYYASGKSSAEGHQWTDAGMVSDYVERNVRAWFRSYPHRQADALVYNKSGFIWNQALDHGKTVRIFGEACETEYDRKLKWADLYRRWQDSIPPDWHNETTIARIRPIIHPTFPDCDNIAFSDQQRADIFIKEWKQYEQDGSLPNLLIMSLPNDHTAGTSPNFPTPNAMVADNDLAVGRIMETITKSKYWDSTVVFITEDDSQSGWDHISAYRTIGLVVSPYSSGKLVTTNYNQTSILRTIEQVLGVPPMNVIDATASLMTGCFQLTKNITPYVAVPNNIPLNEMNADLKALHGEARKYALQSQWEVFNEVDGGEDDKMNRIIWFYAKGNVPYPAKK